MRDIEQIQHLVGAITANQLRYVDCAVNRTIGLFMPIAGRCDYATTPEHTHPSYSFILAFDTYCRTKIGKRIIESIPSTMTVMPPDVPHQELSGETIPRYIAVLIDPVFFHDQLDEYTITKLPEPDEIFPVSERLITACKEFMIDYQEALPGYEKLLEAAGTKICHLIIRQICNIKNNEVKITGRMAINRAIEYIYSHFGERIAVNTLAHEANMSLSHFTRVFRQEMDLSPAEYILKIRLDCAKRMLLSNEKTLTDIALECGFNSSAYFSHCFSKAFKISPSEFKHLHVKASCG
jgi:AraC family transcriptional regulator